jgi:hypothetical protein
MKKLKITLSFASPEKKIVIYIYDVMVKQKNYKRSTNHYFSPRVSQQRGQLWLQTEESPAWVSAKARRARE